MIMFMTLQSSSSKILLKRQFIISPKRRTVEPPCCLCNVLVLRPMLFALLVDALLVKCATKTVMSIRGSPKNAFMKPATVPEVTSF